MMSLTAIYYYICVFAYAHYKVELFRSIEVTLARGSSLFLQ